MDPIKTLVRYALVPLRIVVQLGELYVGQEQRDSAPAPKAEEPSVAQRRPASQAERSQRQRRQRPKPDPQASPAPKDLDDVGLARKVETVIFRDPEIPKGSIDVNAAAGVVWLRGEAKTPDMIKALERQTREVPEVRQVENLLHLPKTPAPTRTDTPPSQRKTRRSPAQPGSRRVTTRVTAEPRSGPDETP
ncbi:MAG: BON domain-containing protein [Thermoleophilaceae bacterium]